MRKPTKTLKQSAKFTKTALEAFQPTATRQTIYDETTAGLAVRISPSGHKAFYYYYRPSGKGRTESSRKIQLGSFPAMTVEQARLKARQLAAQVVTGHDPVVDLRQGKEAVSMATALRLFQDEHVSKLKSGTILAYTAIIVNRLIPKLGKLRVRDVTYSDLARVHHGMNDTPYLANRTLGVASVFFGWAEKHGYRALYDLNSSIF